MPALSKIAAYLHIDGRLGDTVGRKCVCNGLLSNVGFAQCSRDGREESPWVTCGYEVASITQFLSTSYSAADVVEHLLAGIRSHEVTD